MINVFMELLSLIPFLLFVLGFYLIYRRFNSWSKRPKEEDSPKEKGNSKGIIESPLGKSLSKLGKTQAKRKNREMY
jgi:hypothetical protein